VSPGGITLLVHNGAPSGPGKDCGASGTPGGYAGRAYELRLMRELGGTDGFSVGGRQFDGKYTAHGKEIWYEAKSGNYWQMLLNNPAKLQKFKSTTGQVRDIANSNGADFVIYSENPISSEVTDWLDKKGIRHEVR
jgi:hypothetical protein